MATDVIMPALEMAQESGVLVNWLKREGEQVTKGEPLMEIETDKVTVEIDAPASGLLSGLRAREGDVIPVGQTIAWILEPGEELPAALPLNLPSGRKTNGLPSDDGYKNRQPPIQSKNLPIEVSPVARNIAEENKVDLSLIVPSGRRIEKADVMAYIQEQNKAVVDKSTREKTSTHTTQRILASPKARRLAEERILDLKEISGSGPEGAILAADVMEFSDSIESGVIETPSTIWRLMAEHMTQSWTTVPHFYLMREVEAHLPGSQMSPGCGRVRQCPCTQTHWPRQSQ